MKAMAKKSLVLFVSLCFAGSVGMAQVKNDAIRAFNESVERMKAGEDSVIQAFENTIRICEQVGDSAEDIRLKAEQVLPGLYYQETNGLFTADKNISGAIGMAKKTLAVSEKYGNDRVKENTQKLMVQIYSSMASTFYSNKELDKALNAFDSVLMINPDHLPSIYNQALIYRGKGDNEKFGSTIDLYIADLTKTGDSAKVKQAMQIALDYYRIAGAKAHQANDLTKAIDLLTTASKYGNDKNVHYHFAGIYNKQKKFALAEEYALKGLNMEAGTAEEKAKFYYELGTAQAGRGETAKACESFENSLYGPFLQASKAQRTNMKCL